MNKNYLFTFLLIKRKNINPYWVLFINSKESFNNFLELKTEELSKEIENGIKKHFEDYEYFSHQNEFPTHFFCIIEGIAEKLLTVNDANKRMMEQYTKDNLHIYLNGYYSLFNKYGKFYVNIKGGAMPHGRFKILDKIERPYKDFPVNIYKLKISKFNPGVHYYVKLGHIEIKNVESLRFPTYQTAKQAALEYIKENNFLEISPGSYKKVK